MNLILPELQFEGRHLEDRLGGGLTCPLLRPSRSLAFATLCADNAGGGGGRTPTGTTESNHVGVDALWVHLQGVAGASQLLVVEGLLPGARQSDGDAE